jgi:hypothetical protein
MGVGGVGPGGIGGFGGASNRDPGNASLRDALDVAKNEIINDPDGVRKLTKVRGLIGFVLRMVGALLK